MTRHTPPTPNRNHNPSPRARAALLFAATLAFAAAGCATFEETLAQADAGDAAAQYRVAQAYAKGGETAKDPAKAEEYFKKALAGGEKDAKRDLLLLWLETGSVENAQEIIRDYPAVAEGGLFSWGLDVDLLDRAPVFAKALVMAERFDDCKAFALMTADTEARLFKAHQKSSRTGPELKNTEEFRTFMVRMALVDRLLAEKKEEVRRRTEEAERAAQAERERQEAEARAKAEAQRAEAAQRAREEAEARWLARKDNPDFRFPFRDSFPGRIAVYKELQTGCSLEWADEYVMREFLSPAKRERTFLEMASGVEGATERPLPPEFDAKETETSLFVFCPTNLTFVDGGRVVTLTFGAPTADEGRRVLVGGEIHFPKGAATLEALAEKYAGSVSGCERKNAEESVREGGELILPMVRLPVTTTRKALTVLSSDAAAIRILDNLAVSLVWDSPSRQLIRVNEEGKASLGNDDVEERLMAIPQLSGEEVGKAVAIWTDLNAKCGRPAVSIVDRALFRAMVEAKDGAERREAKARREAEEAAERAADEAMKKSLDSF